MPFGGKIYNVSWIGKLTSLEDQHSARLHFFVLTSFEISFEVLWIRILELKRYTTPHYSYTVHCIDKGFGVCF
jgi:hypothetical protein